MLQALEKLKSLQCYSTLCFKHWKIFGKLLRCHIMKVQCKLVVLVYTYCSTMRRIQEVTYFMLLQKSHLIVLPTVIILIFCLLLKSLLDFFQLSPPLSPPPLFMLEVASISLRNLDFSLGSPTLPYSPR
jgi:hypothetical protein